jgi:hypothetical protein
MSVIDFSITCVNLNGSKRMDMMILLHCIAVFTTQITLIKISQRRLLLDYLLNPLRLKMPIHKIIKAMVMEETYFKRMKTLKEMIPLMETRETVMKMMEVVKK